MGLHGLDGKLEAMSDFLGAVALGDELKDLALPRRKLVRRGLLDPDSLNVSLDDLLRDRRTEVSFALHHGFQGKLQFRGR